MDKSLVSFMREMEAVCADLGALAPDSLLYELPAWDDLNRMRLIDHVRECGEVALDIEELAACKTPAEVFALVRKTRAEAAASQEE